MDRTPVNSRAVTSIGYDENTNMMEAEYPNGDVYQYPGVSKWQYDGLASASSIGSALASIRRTHKGIKV